MTEGRLCQQVCHVLSSTGCSWLHAVRPGVCVLTHNVEPFVEVTSNRNTTYAWPASLPCAVLLGYVGAYLSVGKMPQTGINVVD